MTEIATPLLNGAAKSAYARTKGLDDSHGSLHGLKEVEGKTFSDMVSDATKDAVEVIRNSDKVTQEGISGKVGVQEVVQATMAAEATLNTVVGIRDKLVQAYQEVLRMPI